MRWAGFVTNRECATIAEAFDIVLGMAAGETTEAELTEWIEAQSRAS